jgi:hypothetical protein
MRFHISRNERSIFVKKSQEQRRNAEITISWATVSPNAESTNARLRTARGDKIAFQSAPNTFFHRLPGYVFDSKGAPDGVRLIPSLATTHDIAAASLMTAMAQASSRVSQLAGEDRGANPRNGIPKVLFLSQSSMR